MNMNEELFATRFESENLNDLFGKYSFSAESHFIPQKDVTK